MRPAARRPSDRRSRSASSFHAGKIVTAPGDQLHVHDTHLMRAARPEYDARSARTADASDIGSRHPARYGQNDREIALNRKNALFAGSDRGREQLGCASLR